MSALGMLSTVGGHALKSPYYAGKALWKTKGPLTWMAPGFLSKGSKSKAYEEYLQKSKMPGFGNLSQMPYYKQASINTYKRGENMDILKKVGLEKVASKKDPMDLFFNGLEKMSADATIGVSILAEIDSDIALDKLSADLELEEGSDEQKNLPVVIANEYTSGKIDKTASENEGLDIHLLARKTLSKIMPVGEISKIAAATLINIGASDGDTLDKIASEISEDDLNVTKIAIELASEGYSPEMLKESADANGIEFTKMAKEILDGETEAMDKIMNSDMSSEYVEKTAGDKKTSDSFKLGVQSAIIKMASWVHPKGISVHIGEVFQKVASDSSKNADLEAHKYACDGAAVLGHSPESVQSIYSYMDKGYALDKHASVLSEDFKKEAQEAFDTLVKVAVINKKLIGKDDVSGSYSDAIEKFAASLKEDMDKVAKRLFITNNFLSGTNPVEFVTENIDKVASEQLKKDVNAEQHAKVIL